MDAVRDGRPTLVPQHYQAEVGASTKRALAPGERIEGIGCDEVYGYTWPAEVAQQRNLVPLGLTEGATVTKHVAENSALTFDDVELDEASVVVRAWRLQQNLEELGGAPPWRSLLETS